MRRLANPGEGFTGVMMSPVELPAVCCLIVSTKTESFERPTQNCLHYRRRGGNVLWKLYS